MKLNLGRLSTPSIGIIAARYPMVAFRYLHMYILSFFIKKCYNNYNFKWFCFEFKIKIDNLPYTYVLPLSCHVMTEVLTTPGCHETMWAQPNRYWGFWYHQQDSWWHRQSGFWSDATSVFLVWVLIINFRISTTSWRKGSEIQIRRQDTRWVLAPS